MLHCSLLGYLQVAATLEISAEFPSPAGVRSFLSAFTFLTMDPLRYSSASCLTSINFYSTFKLFMLAPIVLAVGLGLTYRAIYFWKFERSRQSHSPQTLFNKTALRRQF